MWSEQHAVTCLEPTTVPVKSGKASLVYYSAFDKNILFFFVSAESPLNWNQVRRFLTVMYSENDHRADIMGAFRAGRTRLRLSTSSNGLHRRCTTSLAGFSRLRAPRQEQEMQVGGSTIGQLPGREVLTSSKDWKSWWRRNNRNPHKLWLPSSMLEQRMSDER